MWRLLDTDNRQDLAFYVKNARVVRQWYRRANITMLRWYLDQWSELEVWVYEGDDFTIGMAMRYEPSVAGYFLQNYWVKGASGRLEEATRVSLQKAKDYMQRHNEEFHSDEPQQMTLRMYRDTEGDTRMFFKKGSGIRKKVLDVSRSIFPYVHVQVESGKHNDIRVGVTKNAAPLR